MNSAPETYPPKPETQPVVVKQSWPGILALALATVVAVLSFKIHYSDDKKITAQEAIIRSYQDSAWPLTSIAFSNDGVIVYRKVPQGSPIHIITSGPANNRHLIDVRLEDTPIPQDGEHTLTPEKVPALQTY